MESADSWQKLAASRRQTSPIADAKMWKLLLAQLAQVQKFATPTASAYHYYGAGCWLFVVRCWPMQSACIMRRATQHFEYEIPKCQWPAAGSGRLSGDRTSDRSSCCLPACQHASIPVCQF